MRILITIPTWNEAAIISRTLERVAESVREFLSEHEVVVEVADNGSTDGTAGLLVEPPLKIRGGRGSYESEGTDVGGPRFSLLALREKGKGLAIQTSWERHVDDADILIFTDADLAADLSVLSEMVRLIESGDADIVCGSRFVRGAHVVRTRSRELASRLFRFLQKQILHLPVEDAQCGLKAISSSAARMLLPLCRERGWMFDSELLFHGMKNGLRIREVPVRWVETREPGRRSAIRLFRDGWGFLLGLARIRG